MLFDCLWISMYVLISGFLIYGFIHEDKFVEIEDRIIEALRRKK